MRGVNLHGIKPHLERALRRLRKALHHPLHLLRRQRLGLRIRPIIRNRARRPHILRPAAILHSRHVVDAALQEGVVPGQVAGLAPGVRQLDAGVLALRVDEVDDALHGRDLRVVPEADVARGDAAVGEDRGRFEDGEGGAAEGEGAEVDEVEVGHEAVQGRVHAHGRDGEAVGEGEAAELEGGEEGGG